MKYYLIRLHYAISDKDISIFNELQFMDYTEGAL